MNAQSSIIPFTFENSTTIRTESIEGQPWFLAKDLCEALGYSNYRDALRRHCFVEDVAKHDTLTSGGNQLMTWVNESGMYALIFGSKLPSAQAFKRWVTSEVLPTLRNQGHFEVVKRDKENELTDKETQLIKDFLYRMTNFVGYTQSYINACWYAIRQTTGVKSPGKFRHTDIPVIMEELKRICFITECYNNARREAEEALFKKIIRKKGSFKELTDILGTMVTRSVDDSDLAKIQKLDRRNVDQDIQKLQQQIGA